jgi:hypothetical protein
VHPPLIGLLAGEWLPTQRETMTRLETSITRTTGQKQQLLCGSTYLPSFGCRLVAMVEKLRSFSHVFVTGLLSIHNILTC